MITIGTLLELAGRGLEGLAGIHDVKDAARDLHEAYGEHAGKSKGTHHSPPRWRVVRHGAIYHISSRGRHAPLICTVWNDTEGEQHPNAALIAHAPEFFRACQLYLRTHGMICDCPGCAECRAVTMRLTELTRKLRGAVL